MRRPYLYVLVLLCFAAGTQSLFAFGSREKDERGEGSEVQTEESRKISLILIGAGSTDQTAMRNLLAGEASLFLYQEYTVSDTRVQVTSNRRFSMPVEKRQKIDLSGIPLAVEYQIELDPAVPVSYRKVQELDVAFSAKELISADRVRLQPGRSTLIKAAGDAELTSGLIRIKSLTYNRKGEILSRVEIAQKLE